MSIFSGTVYLVGAGCGQADLITVRGLKLLQSCDAVVYDGLIAQELLDTAPKQAQRLYMGRQEDGHSAAPAEICAKLVELARQGKTVVRLQGGDPFVFGRGGEEAMALQAAGVPFEVVPGVASATAIPALAGIPVTHQGLSQSFHVIASHTPDAEDGLPAYIDDLARLPGTLVLLMGLSRLEQVVQRLLDAGREADTPAAVLSEENTPRPAAVRGTLADIAERARTVGIQPPTILVVGDTAALELTPAPVEEAGAENPSGPEQSTSELDQIICYFMRTVLHIQDTGLADLPLKNPLEQEPCRSFLDRCMDIFCQGQPPQLSKLLLDAEYGALVSRTPLTPEQTLSLRAVKELCWHIYYDRDGGLYGYLEHIGNLWGSQARTYAWRTYYPNLPESVRKELHVDENALEMIPREMLRLDDY